MRILVVEDEPATRNAVERILTAEGYDVSWAVNGRGALEQMRILRPDLVLLDIMLGEGMTGWDVLREKILDPRIRPIPVIVLTGLSAEEVHRGAAPESILSGALLVLGKPYDVEALLGAVARVGAGREAGR